MNLKSNRSGFTLLEIIIVLIIVGVLSSLALPRFFSTIEFSRSTEALSSLGVVRKSIERCSLSRAGLFTNCDNFANIDIADPATADGNHFTYVISTVAGLYTITATRNGLAGGDGSSTVVLTSGDPVTRAGTGVFQSIN